MAKLNHSQIQSLLRQAGWQDIIVDTYTFSPKKCSGRKTFDGKKPLIALMSAIAMQESGGNPTAHNPRGENSHGLLQINLNAWGSQISVANAQNALKNLTFCWNTIYRQQKLCAWGGYTDGGYKKYYSAALTAYNGKTTNNPTVSNPVITTNEVANVIADIKNQVPEKKSNNDIYLLGGLALVLLFA